MKQIKITVPDGREFIVQGPLTLPDTVEITVAEADRINEAVREKAHAIFSLGCSSTPVDMEPENRSCVNCGWLRNSSIKNTVMVGCPCDASCINASQWKPAKRKK